MARPHSTGQRGPFLFLALCMAALLGVGGSTAGPPALVLVSFDGFRWDYPERFPTPEIGRLLTRGAHARALVPPFPSKTFPSHYTQVTGLYPAHHGIIANTMYDPALQGWFSLADRRSVGDGRWWGGEPVWVTAERQGLLTGTLFWPGSEAPIHGVRPHDWALYDGTMTHEKQIETALGWLDRPAAQRPALVTLYFDDTDLVGHRDGPTSASVGVAVRRLDDVLGQLRRGLEQRGLADRVHLVITSDHGMTEVSRERVVVLDDYIDLADASIVDWSPVLAISARNGDHEALYRRLHGANPHLQVFRREETPERLHFRNNPRITPIVGLADEGWTTTSRERLRGSVGLTSRGDHGFDNALPSMHGILIASGPAFAPGAVIPPVESVHLYALFCRLLGVTAAANDGRADALDGLRRR